MTTILAPAQVARLRAQDLTYSGVGLSVVGSAPPGYHAFERSRLLRGVAFEDAVERLMTWQVHERAGLRVAASASRVGLREVVLMRLGVGPVSLRVPCRVVHIVEAPDSAGFAYGTLPGHPEAGEECFFIERDGDDVRMRIRAFSLPASRIARVSGPIGRFVQHAMTNRYFDAA